MEIILGTLFVLLGGFANGSFYIPYKKVKNWSWEVYWIIGGIFSWIIAPWIFSLITIPNLSEIFKEASFNTLFKPFIFGVLWGVGGLTFGLSMRYLGVALGMSIALGLTLVFGALLPSILVSIYPAFFGNLFPDTAPFGNMISTMSGLVTLLGVIICIIGIAINGKAGMMKDKEVAEDVKKESIKDFNVNKGILVALFSGLMSAAFAMGVAAGKPLAEITASKGTNPVFQNNPSFILIMFGGFLINLIWCLYLQVKNKSYIDFTKPPIINNLGFSALAGILWYLQMFFYGMGESILSGVASWSLLMASSIIFSNMWGLLTKEWQGVSKKTMRTLIIGLIILISSTIVFGIGKELKTKENIKVEQTTLK